MLKCHELEDLLASLESLDDQTQVCLCKQVPGLEGPLCASRRYLFPKAKKISLHNLPCGTIPIADCSNQQAYIVTRISGLIGYVQKHRASGHGEGRVRLVLIDSIAGPISPVLGGGPSFHGHSLMVETATTLKRTAASHNFAVVVTNHMAAGAMWENQSHRHTRPIPQLRLYHEQSWIWTSLLCVP